MLLRWILHLCFMIYLRTSCVTCVKKSSLTFVIDDTRSMWDDIDQVREAAEEIMNIVTREKASEIEDVVLVTFNDPEVLLRQKTSNKNELIDALNGIVVHNTRNYDCPEYALSGIEKGLIESKIGSYLFVFTDATAKDYRRVNEIISLCEKQQSQVVFVLTGDCHDPFSPGYRVYHEIAKASNGQVFRVTKDDVKNVLDTIKETVKGHKSVVTSVIVPANPFLYTPVPFTVDDKTEYVIVSASGRNIELFVTDRSTRGGRNMNTERIMWKPSGKVVKFDAPAPGTYYAWTKGETDISIVVYARTDFTFDHGFSEFVPKSLADASKLPIADRKHYLSISVTDPEHTVDIKTAEILDMSDRVIAQLPLRKANGDFYITDTFVSPSTMFKIQVTGRVKKTGQDIRRISKTAIEPQKPPPPKPMAPVVTITEGSRLDIDYNGEITLTCKVSGYPAPQIIWTSADGTVLSTKSNVVELPYKYISYIKLSNVKNRGTYYCRAHNEEARKFARIDVGTRSPFTVTASLLETTPAKYGEEVKLQCGISSLYPMEVKWNIPLQPSASSLSADNKVLTIKSMDFAAQGRYTCEATLKSDPKQKVEVATNVVISNLAAPAISPATPSEITVSHGEQIHIWCKIAGGVPRPSVSWQVMKNNDNKYRDLPVSGEELIVNSARLEDAGQYRCIATNRGGQTSKITKVIVQMAPEVFIEDGEKKSVAYGSSNELNCKIVAFPLPNIAWRDSRGNKLDSKDIITNNEITSQLNLPNIKVSDTYTCVAENILGKTVSNIDISVSSPFVVHSHPKDTTISKYGKQTDITCDIKSPFPLKIRWFFKKNVLAVSEIHTSNKYTVSPTGTTLQILYTDLDTVGKYTCEASLLNDGNQKVDFTTNVQLDNLSPPVLQNTEPKIITVQNKDKVKIPCKILRGIPPPVIIWQVMRNDDKVIRDILASGQELTLDSATLVDAGQYRCTAKNAQGQAYKVTELVVQQAPEASIDEGATITVPYGSTNEFNCRIVAFPLPNIVFRDSKGNTLMAKNTVNNNYDLTSRLKIENIKSSETYSCYAENNLGKTVKSIKVSVLSPIDFTTKQPEKTSVKYEDPTDIICDARSAFPMRIKWFYQKNELSKMLEINTSDKYMLSPDKRTLHITSTDQDLVGKYTCEVSLLDDENEKKSITTKVEINNLKAPEITDSDKTVTVMHGQKMTTFCKANGIPKPDVTWEFKPKAANVFTTIPAKGERITNHKIDYEWAGSYKCTATSAVGTQSRIIDIIVHGEPKITNVDSVYFGVTGDEVLKIPCEVTGVPEPIITWKHENKVVTSDKKISVDKNALFIKNPTEKDSGNFTCEAKNKYGNTLKTFEASVSDFIVPDEDLNNIINLKVGESKNIKCRLPHSNPQSVRWYVNSEKSNVTGSFYSLKNANFSNDGNYTCRLNTDQGSQSLNYVVDVGYEPSFTAAPSPTITWNGNKQDILDCNVRAKPKEVVEWFYNGKQVHGKNISELAISGWGAYTCKVSNVHGSVQHSFNVTSDGCLINRTADRVKNTPLIIGDEPSTWPKFETEFEFLTLSRNQIITLECSTQDQPSNPFKTHPKVKRINAECFNEDKFTVDGEIYKFEDLHCKEYVKPSEVFTKKPCMENGEIVEVGFKLNNGFLGVYDACYSEIDHKLLNTKVVMSDVNMGNRVTPSFKLNQGIKTGKPSEITKCHYNKRWLVNPVDVAFGPAQTATLSDKYNAVPVYEPCEGSKRLSWSGVENIVQSTMYTMYKLTAWTGASHYDSRGIPRYLWKVAKFEDETFEVIVYVNTPNPDSSDILCPKTTPEKFTDIMVANDQYTYSCSIGDFLNAFNVPMNDFDINF